MMRVPPTRALGPSSVRRAPGGPAKLIYIGNRGVLPSLVGRSRCTSSKTRTLGRRAELRRPATGRGGPRSAGLSAALAVHGGEHLLGVRNLGQHGAPLELRHLAQPPSVSRTVQAPGGPSATEGTRRTARQSRAPHASSRPSAPFALRRGRPPPAARPTPPGAGWAATEYFAVACADRAGPAEDDAPSGISNLPPLSTSG